MKTIAAFLFALVLSIQISNAQWVQMNNGMGNIVVYALAANGNIIFAGTDNGVYLSADNGSSWTQTSLNNRFVYSMTVNGNNIFAGTNGSGVYLSANNGANWTQTSLNNRFVYSMAVNGNNIFAGTFPNTGVYLSTNNGTNWTQTSLNNQNVWALSANGNNIFAGTDNGVYLSTNSGTNWNQSSLNNRTVLALAVNGNNIFAGSQFFGVYLSANYGANWAQTSLNNQTVLSLAQIGNNIFAGGITLVYVSNDNGTTWTQRNEGLFSSAYSFYILNNFIFAGTNGSGVYRRPLAELIGIEQISNEIPNKFSLSQNYPNPFNPMTNVKFQMPNEAFVKLTVFDILGKEAATLVNEELSPGTYEVDWNASSFPSGVYYYKLTAGNYTETKKMILIK